MSTLQRCVVAGGGGAVGAMFTELLRSTGAEVCVVETAPPPAGTGSRGVSWLTADITVPGSEVRGHVAAADLVLLAVPEPVALAAARPLAALMRPGAVLVDTLSVKSRMLSELACCPAWIGKLGINPMFAPSLGMAGRPVAAVTVQDGPGVTAFLGLIEEWGGRPLRLSPDEHDRITAATQALTHATVLGFGLALAELPVGIDRLTAAAPPPHTLLLALLARMTGGSPEVYWDIQRANPHAAQARDALARGLRQLADLVDGGSPADLSAAFGRIRDLLGPEAQLHREYCEQAFTALHATKTTTESGAKRHDGTSTGE
ncbi:prephenate dehydrogenase dimerization domain-containing protein [Streptomyces sp. NPDC002536]